VHAVILRDTHATRKLIPLFLLLIVSAAARAADEPQPHWRSIVVRFTIADDGLLHVAEHAEIDVPPGVTKIERSYWSSGEMRVKFDSVSVGGKPLHFESPWGGKVVWTIEPSTEARTMAFDILTTVTDAVIPAWSLPHGTFTHDSHAEMTDPKLHLKSLLKLWSEALPSPRSRYLLDYQYEMPGVSEEGTDIQLQLYWPDAWNPVHFVTGDTIATKTNPDTYNSTRWRATHLFDAGSNVFPPGIDVRRHAIRMASIVALPVACLLVFLLFLVIETWRRRGGGDFDEHRLGETLMSEPPEIIAARWSGRAMKARIEPFLRRLEKKHKIDLTIEKTDDDENNVSLRLLVPREELTPYERAGIDALMPEGREITSAEIRAKHEDDFFDPADALEAELGRIAKANKAQAPWYSKFTSFVLFAGGMALLVMEIAKNQREPILMFGALVCCSTLMSLWPDSAARYGISNSLRWSVVLLIPLAVVTAIVWGALLLLAEPPGVYGAAGFSLVFFALYKAIVAASAPRAPADLLRARNWLRAELKSERPRLRDEMIPWLSAVGLSSDVDRWKRRAQAEPSRFFTGGWSGTYRETEEEWGDALVA
jgi:hypothetical protein